MQIRANLRGTGETVPRWVSEIVVMEKFGLSERELREDMTLGMIQKAGYLDYLRDKYSENPGK
jgi:hypothetical protein